MDLDHTRIAVDFVAQLMPPDMCRYYFLYNIFFRPGLQAPPLFEVHHWLLARACCSATNIRSWYLLRVKVPTGFLLSTLSRVRAMATWMLISPRARQSCSSTGSLAAQVIPGRARPPRILLQAHRGLFNANGKTLPSSQTFPSLGPMAKLSLSSQEVRILIFCFAATCSHLQPLASGRKWLQVAASGCPRKWLQVAAQASG